MKAFLFGLALLCSPAFGLGELWTLTEDVQAPESAYYDPRSKVIFVSNIVGAPTDKDGVGWIHQVSVDGKMRKAKWVSGLNAPKGMRSHGGTLWVSDIDTLVGIDIETATVKTKVLVPGAKFLNDVAVSASGKVFVSDTLTSRIYQYNDGKLSLFAEGDALESPNGLVVVGNDLVVAAWGRTSTLDFATKTPGNLYKINLKTRAKSNITTSPLGNLDGLEAEGDGSYLVSDWVAGKIYRVTASGKATLLLEGLKGPADFALVGNTLVVPRMHDNAVTAYNLKE